MFYCICRGARVEMRRGFHLHGCVTAQASRNSAHDGEGESKRGLVTVVHRVNYTIFAALCVGFRGRFPWPRKVSVVRREQIRVLNQNCRGLSTFQPFNRRSPTFQPALYRRIQPFCHYFATSQCPPLSGPTRRRRPDFFKFEICFWTVLRVIIRAATIPSCVRCGFALSSDTSRSAVF